ncbi:nuclear transport factor 2 family protein [Spirillospora sp. NPDC048911]|uniref:nuclear transport factor 2 family protein n=1 Tax=Spirillospora sp. NPDC048911 TaxID=3364527 RepID=UPI00372152B3
MSHDIIQNAFQALASNDPDQICAVLTEDAEWLSPPGNATAVALGVAHHMVGEKAIARFFAEDFPRLFVRDVALSLHASHTGGERATVEAAMTATLANGNHYANDYCFVFELKNDLIHRVREYVDTARGHRLIFGEVKAPQSPADRPGRGDRRVRDQPR